jgi:hypothetical protein
MKKGTKAEVSRHMAGPPEKLYEVVSDVPRMGEWSPECLHCEWIDGATGAIVGARFKGTSKRGLVRWSTTPLIVTAEEGRQFAFVTNHRGHDETKWTYRFEADSGGTMVTESFEMLSDLPWYLRLAERVLMGVKDRKADLESGMIETLRRLQAAVDGEGSATTRSMTEHGG